MTRLLTIFLALLAPLHAAEWRNDEFGCVVNLPEGGGWEAIPTPAVPGVTVLVAMQNEKRQANFIVNVIDNAPGKDLADPKVQQHLSAMLRAFTYEFYGFSKVQLGGISWLQYPVTSRAGGAVTKGVVRYASGNGRIFSVSLMLGGGREPSQDLELQGIAGSFRFVTPGTAKPAIVAASPPKPVAQKHPSDIAPVAPRAPETLPPDGREQTVLGGIPIAYVRYTVVGASVLLVLVLLFYILRGGRPRN